MLHESNDETFFIDFVSKNSLQLICENQSLPRLLILLHLSTWLYLYIKYKWSVLKIYYSGGSRIRPLPAKQAKKKVRKISVLGIKIIGPPPLGGARAGCAPPGSASDDS